MHELTQRGAAKEARKLRLWLMACLAPSYVYYCVNSLRTGLSWVRAVVPGLCAALLAASQWISLDGASHSWRGFATPVAGALLNASVIYSSGYERSPFLFVVLIPLLTYAIERDARLAVRSTILNSAILAFLAFRSLLRRDWFAFLNVLGLSGLVVAGSYHIAHTRNAVMSVLARMRREGRRDPLTRLYNRRALEEKARDLMDDGVPFALAMCDIDGFKRYNDTYGHLAGDQVLERIAQILVRAMSPGGVAFRWGGDEFVLILPLVDRMNAECTCSRINQLIGSEFGELSISYGVSVFPEDGLSLEELLGVADKHLYQAKNRAFRNPDRLRGEDCVVTWRSYGHPGISGEELERTRDAGC